jgi:hypothetical protein
MLVNLLIGLAVFLLLALAVAPLDALGWWSRKGADEAAQTVAEIVDDAATQAPQPYEHYVVYLSGIGAIDGRSVPPEEEPLIAAISALPDTCVIRDVFPYSVVNKGLTGQRQLAWLWRWVERLRLKNPDAIAGMLVNVRNATQLFVSADRRYGPAYNIGTALEIVQALRRRGYQLDGGKPVTLIGWSGGAQISIGAAAYLGMGKMPVQVISIGGMMSDDPGLNRVEHLWHLRGTRDIFEKLGSVMFAGRWPGAKFSPWTRGLAEGRIEVIDLGPIHHNAKRHYFDTSTIAPDGRSYLQVTTDAVIAVLTGSPVRTIAES